MRSPERDSEIAAAVDEMVNLLTGSGEHADHERRQVGRCVYCSCGERVQGRLGELSRGFEVVLSDGFVCYRHRTRRSACEEIAARHDGASVRQQGTPA